MTNDTDLFERSSFPPLLTHKLYDTPFRVTEEMIAVGRKHGIFAVEMEAAALYALAEVRQYKIICFTHVNNQMGQAEGDFEKGQAQGSLIALWILSQTTAAWKSSLSSENQTTNSCK